MLDYQRKKKDEYINNSKDDVDPKINLYQKIRIKEGEIDKLKKILKLINIQQKQKQKK